MILALGAFVAEFVARIMNGLPGACGASDREDRASECR